MIYTLGFTAMMISGMSEKNSNKRDGCSNQPKDSGKAPRSVHKAGQENIRQAPKNDKCSYDLGGVAPIACRCIQFPQSKIQKYKINRKGRQRNPFPDLREQTETYIGKIKEDNQRIR